MTIDERLKAIAQNVKRTALMQQAEEKRAAERDAITDQRLNRVLDGIEKVTIIVQNHEQRIEGLES